MFIGLENMYGYDKHELVTDVKSDYEYVGEVQANGVKYICYLVPNGLSYKAVAIARK